jgi:ferric-dicitrate binding protein FerR (iron transport regulator)
MTKEAFKNILARYLNGDASAWEEWHVDKWYEEIEKKLANNAASLIDDNIGEDIFEKIRFEIELSRKKKSRLLFWLPKIAAVVVLVSGATIIYFGAKFFGQKETAIIKPGTDKAVLRLANGSEIVLEENYNDSVITNDGNKVIRLDSGTIAYENNKITASEKLKYNEMIVPSGGKYSLRLPDGTKVWVNAASSLKFPEKFAAAERRVIVKGEAYFEVAPQKNKPFIVEIPGKQQVSVLGTHFNINSYDDEQAVATTLLEGSIKINVAGSDKSVTLQPGQQSLVFSEQKIITKNDVDVQQAIAWKEGYFSFDQTDISDIAKQISRWYGATVILDPKVKGQTFSGKIPRTEDIQNVLKIFEATNTVKCRVSGNQITIYPKK